MKSKQIVKKPLDKQTKAWAYHLIILMVCFVLYGQSISNNFNIDDDYVYENHELVQKGIKGIPEIFTTRYNTKDDQYFGYRPLTIAICAVEHEMFGQNPHTAHLFNIIYYALCCSLLFYLLAYLFKPRYENNYLWLAFLVTLVFCTHAIHTEVVLSIKNREEIVALILGLLSTIFALKYFDNKRIHWLILSVIFIAMAFLAKESAIVFIVLIPFLIIFFKTDLKFLQKFKINLKEIHNNTKPNSILFYLLFSFILLFLFLGPITKQLEQNYSFFYLIGNTINEFIALLFFLIVYPILIIMRKSSSNKVKISKRNIVLWVVSFFVMFVPIITPYKSLGVFTMIFLLATLLPEKNEKKIFEIRLFDNLSQKFVFSIIAIVVLAGITISLVYFIPKQSLPEINAPVFKWQNPAFDNESTIFDKIAISLYSMIYYIKLLIIPYPLRFYYGYKMIPDVSIFHPVVILSLLFHLYLIYTAIRLFNKRNLISLGIIFYIIAIFPFANTFFPLTGIIAERMLFVPSIGFSIALIFLITHLKKIDLSASLNKSKKYSLLAISLIIILPNSLISLNRNEDWKDRKTLYSRDIKHLENSAKANTLYGNLLIGEVYSAVKNNVPINSLRTQVEQASSYFNRAIEIDSTYSNPWHNLGYINMILYKNYQLAEVQFGRCLAVDSTIAAAYLNRGITNYYLQNYKQSIIDLNDYLTKNTHYKDKELDKANVFTAKSYFELRDTASATKYYLFALENLKMQNLSKAVLDDIKNYFLSVGSFENAIKVLDVEIGLNPDIDLPHIEKGNYYLLSGDTINAIANWELGFEKYHGNFNIGMTLSSYFRDKGNVEKANYYYNSAIDFRQKQGSGQSQNN